MSAKMIVSTIERGEIIEQLFRYESIELEGTYITGQHNQLTAEPS